MRSIFKLAVMSFALVFLMASVTCYAQRNYHPSQLWYNGKRYNSLIVGRIADYGDGHTEGCIVMGEMKVELRDIDQQTVQGMVKDVDNGKPVLAQIRLVKKDGTADTLKTDDLGRFKILKSSPIKKLYVRSVAYRELQIETARFLFIEQK